MASPTNRGNDVIGSSVARSVERASLDPVGASGAPQAAIASTQELWIKL